MFLWRMPAALRAGGFTGSYTGGQRNRHIPLIQSKLVKINDLCKYYQQQSSLLAALSQWRNDCRQTSRHQQREAGFSLRPGSILRGPFNERQRCVQRDYRRSSRPRLESSSLVLSTLPPVISDATLTTTSLIPKIDASSEPEA